MSNILSWLRRLAEQGGRGVVNNIDARSLGRAADEIERLQGRLDKIAMHPDASELIRQYARGKL